MVHKPSVCAILLHPIAQPLSVIQVLLAPAILTVHLQLLILAVVGKAPFPFCPCYLQYTSLAVIGKDVFPCVPCFLCQLVLPIIGISCHLFRGLLSRSVPCRVICITGRAVMILLLHQLPPDVITVRGPDLLFPAIGYSLLPVLCGPVPIAIILITEREQDVLPRLCFQAAHVPISIIVVLGDHMVPIGDLPDPILAIVPVPDFHALAIKDPAFEFGLQYHPHYTIGCFFIPSYTLLLTQFSST